MVGRTKTATKEERRRFQDIQSLGCLACHIEGHPPTPCEIHHLISGYRIGHHASIGLCAHHHRGIPEGHLAPSRMELIKGPSLARNSREFHARYGSDEELLELQEKRLEAHRKNIIGRG